MSSASFTAELRPPGTGRHGLTRVALAVAVFGLSLAPVAPAEAQAAPTKRNGWEFWMSSGALVPTGAQRNVIKDAQLSTVQLSYVIESRLAITTMVSWARSRDLASVGDPKLDVFTYDVGAEARAPRWAASKTVTFTPFVGIGAGARSYNYRSLDVDATHNIAGYGAVGGELGVRRIRVRLEARDYVAGFKPLAGAGVSATRNDVVALVGLRFTKRGA